MAINTLGLFFGSSTCYTDIVSEKIAALIKSDYPQWHVESHNIAEHSIIKCTDYTYALYGIPTWDYGELQEDWDNQWDCLQTLNLSHQQAAIFGLGDQIGYPEWYQDALGYLYVQLHTCGANLHGLWPTTNSSNKNDSLYHHEFEQSQAVTDDGQYFLGLPLDEENQSELTIPRLNIWLKQVLEKSFV